MIYGNINNYFTIRIFHSFVTWQTQWTDHSWMTHHYPICISPFTTHTDITHVGITWAHVANLEGNDCVCPCLTHILAKSSSYVFPCSEPIQTLPMWVLPWAGVGSLYGINCICPCLTHLLNPYVPHLCCPFRTHAYLFLPIWELLSWPKWAPDKMPILGPCPLGTHVDPA